MNAHWSDEYIIPEASDGDVADTACPGRILLGEQQVSLSLFLIKTETDTQAIFSSHSTGAPKAHGTPAIFRARVGFGTVFVCCFFCNLKGGELSARWGDIL
jgi:hypothetical protein